MKQIIGIELVPSYECNLRCPFCIEWKRYDGTRMDLNILEKQLEILSKEFNFKHISVSGGEISILPEEYLKNILHICHNYSDTICITTNFIIPLHTTLLDLADIIRISYDPFTRENQYSVLTNILEADNYNFDVEILPTKYLIQNYKILENLLHIRNINPTINLFWNSANLDIVDFTDDELFQFIKYYIDKKIFGKRIFFQNRGGSTRCNIATIDPYHNLYTIKTPIDAMNIQYQNNDINQFIYDMKNLHFKIDDLCESCTYRTTCCKCIGDINYFNECNCFEISRRVYDYIHGLPNEYDDIKRVHI